MGSNLVTFATILSLYYTLRRELGNTSSLGIKHEKENKSWVARSKTKKVKFGHTQSIFISQNHQKSSNKNFMNNDFYEMDLSKRPNDNPGQKGGGKSILPRRTQFLQVLLEK